MVDPLGDASAEDDGATETGERPPQERTEVIPRGLASARVDTPARGPARRRGARATARRTKMTLRHVDPVSVLKLSLVFYLCVLAIWMLIVAVLYTLLESAGVFDVVENLGRTAVLWTRLDISLWFVERWTLLIGGLLAVLGAIVNVVAVVIYNIAADVVGGARMTFVERDL